MKKISYDAKHHGSFEQEWGLHKGCREWWYATGIMFDEDGNMYSYQYTLLHLALGLAVPKVAMVALTDYKNKRHYYLQTTNFGGGLLGKLGAKKASDNTNNGAKEGAVFIDENEASVAGVASARKQKDGIRICLHHKDFDMDLLCGFGKGPVWHCDDGLLQMGIPDAKATTLYYSWTNMPSVGALRLGGRDIKLTGKTWFDKQGGPYNMANMKCHWEWFSLRFFDDEEAMLFTFPHNKEPEFDGTFVAKDGSYHRLNNYRIESLGQTEHKGLLWSCGWRLHMDEKEQDYLIEPLQEGHMNFAYFEELCSIKNADGDVVGYAFAELLPGVLNQDRLAQGSSDISMKNLFARVEF